MCSSDCSRHAITNSGTIISVERFQPCPVCPVCLPCCLSLHRLLRPQLTPGCIAFNTRGWPCIKICPESTKASRHPSAPCPNNSSTKQLPNNPNNPSTCPMCRIMRKTLTTRPAMPQPWLPGTGTTPACTHETPLEGEWCVWCQVLGWSCMHTSMPCHVTMLCTTVRQLMHIIHVPSPMPTFPAIVFLRFHLENNDFWSTELLNYFCFDIGILKIRVSHRKFTLLLESEYTAKLEAIPNICFQTINGVPFSWFDEKLRASDFHNGIGRRWWLAQWRWMVFFNWRR